MNHRSVLPANWDVPQEFRDRLGDTAGRQRAMVADGHLLLVLHRPPKPNEFTRAGRYFWRNPGGEWAANDLGGGPAALINHLGEFSEQLVLLDQRQEAAQLATQYFEVLESTGPIHRAARNLHATLQEARQLCPQVHELINFRDKAYEIERNAELLYEDAKNGLEFAIAKRAEEQAAASHQMAVSAHRWNLLAAFFFPMVTLASIFGTNLKHGLEDVPAPVPFLAVMAVGLVAGVLLKSALSKP